MSAVVMAMFVNCDCGAMIAVTEGMAGTKVTCGCGRSVDVPNLLRLRGNASSGESTSRASEISSAAADDRNMVRRSATLGIVVTFFTPIVVYKLYTVANRGFDEGDIPALAFWTSGLCVLVLFVGLGLQRFLLNRPAGIRRLTAASAGIGLGFGWTIMVATALGPWFGGFGFPVLLLWMIGAALGLICFVWPDSVP